MGRAETLRAKQTGQTTVSCFPQAEGKGNFLGEQNDKQELLSLTSLKTCRKFIFFLRSILLNGGGCSLVGKITVH